LSFCNNKIDFIGSAIGHSVFRIVFLLAAGPFKSFFKRSNRNPQNGSASVACVKLIHFHDSAGLAQIHKYVQNEFTSTSYGHHLKSGADQIGKIGLNKPLLEPKCQQISNTSQTSQYKDDPGSQNISYNRVQNVNQLKIALAG
jgi:hypothetical protein